MMIAFIILETAYNLLFFVMMFLTRNVRDEFTINRELRTMTISRFLADMGFLIAVVFLPYSPFVFLGCAEYF